MKPRLYRLWGRYWVCCTRDCLGYGATMADAYQEWWHCGRCGRGALRSKENNGIPTGSVG